MKRLLLLSFLFGALGAYAQNPSPIRLDTLTAQGLALDQGWRWQAGDDPAWAAPGYDDSRWESIDPGQPINTQDKIVAAEVGWLRLEFQADSAVIGRVLGLLTQQVGASEIYLNGRLLRKLGVVGKAGLGEQTAYSSFGTLNYFTITQPGKQVLAVRYSFSKDNWLFPYRLNGKRPAFAAQVFQPTGYSEQVLASIRYISSYNWFLAGLFLMMAILHLFYYLYNRAKPINRTFGIALLLAFIHFAVAHLQYSTASLLRMEFYVAVYSLSIALYIVLLAYTIARYLSARPSTYFWILAGAFLMATIIPLISSADVWNPYVILVNRYVYLVSAILLYVELARLAFAARRQQIKDATVILVTVILMVVFFALRDLIVMQLLPIPYASDMANVFMTSFYLCAAVVLSILLAKNNGEVELALEKKLREVEALSAEKQHILATQNETLERQITERTAALNHSLETLKATQAQLIQSEKLASLGELTAGIAHEIQNPLNFVNNYAEVSRELLDELRMESESLQDGASAAGDESLIQELYQDLDDNLAKITHHGKRAESIVNGMLQHTRRSTGDRAPTDLNALADEYLRLAYHGLRARDRSFNATMTTDFTPNLPPATVAAAEIGRVLLNLINNAFYAVQQREKENPGGSYQPTVTVATRQNEKGAEISVTDNGSGIPAEVAGKIFQPFFTTKPTGEGTGLGLSLSYDIMKAHGGELSMNTEVGKGTTFVMSLPI